MTACDRSNSSNTRYIPQMILRCLSVALTMPLTFQALREPCTYGVLRNFCSKTIIISFVALSFVGMAPRCSNTALGEHARRKEISERIYVFVTHGAEIRFFCSTVLYSCSEPTAQKTPQRIATFNAYAFSGTLQTPPASIFQIQTQRFHWPKSKLCHC